MRRTKRKFGINGAFKIRPKTKGEKPSPKERAELYSAAASLFYKMSASIGAIIVFAYLFEIGFFPTGLTAAEVIFFVFVAMGFGVLYLFLLCYGAVSAIWLVHLLERLRDTLAFKRRRGKARSKAWNFPVKPLACQIHRVRFRVTRASRRIPHVLHPDLRGYVYTLVSVGLCAVLLLLVVVAKTSSFRGLLIGIFFGGFVALMFSNVNAGKTRATSAKKGRWTSWRFRLFLALVFPLLLLLPFGGATGLIYLVFQQLGIRIPNVSVEVPASELDSVERVSDALRRPLLDCHRSSNGRLLIHHADVLWTSIGNTTYLSFSVNNPVKPGWFGPDPKPLQQATLRLDASSVHVIEARPPLNPCFDLPSDMLFGSARYELTPEANARLKALVSSIQTDGQPVRIIVRGHSDSRRISGQMERDVGDNQRLSERRAAAVAEALRELIKVPGLKITSEGAGSREPKVNCPIGSATTPYEAEQCNAPNRRVEIRVTYASGVMRRNDKPQ
ncbi:OmpA family protein [Paraburkholderia sp. RCC_158]|uniref:OmpA family protein n=1 Tax=Paraburkholderia sp. RCC_158 TaxID=3239220 RepID=UPI003524FC86